MDATDREAIQSISHDKDSLFPSQEDLSSLTIKEKLPVDRREYNMNHKRRGRAIIFNHQTFNNKPSILRKGTNTDQENLNNTLSKLGFQVEIHEDKEFDDIKQILDEVRRENHEDADCLLVIVMTHGEDDNLMDSNYRKYEPEELWSVFDAENCPSLAFKPKMFFLQAYQMERLERASVAMGSDRKLTYTIPTHADFLVISATVRKQDTGSNFLRALCRVLQQEADSEDLVSMLTEVTRIVALENENMSGTCQVPRMTSLLTRKVYLGKSAKKGSVFGRVSQLFN